MRKIKPATASSKLDSNKKLFTLMLVVTVIIILDSQIGYISDFIPETISSPGGISLFIGFAMIFIVTQFFILNYVKQLNRENKDRISHLHLLQTGGICWTVHTYSYNSYCRLTDFILTGV